MGQLHKRGEPGLEVGVIDHGTLEKQFTAGVARLERADRVAPKRGVLREQRSAMEVAVEGAETLQRPERVDCTRASVLFLHHGLQRGDGIDQVVVHDQTLRGLAPKDVAAVEGGDDRGGRGAGERLDRRGRAILPDHAVNAAVLIGAERAGVRRAAAGRGGVAGVVQTWRRIVLDNEVLEISDPNRTVGADIGIDG